MMQVRVPAFLWKPLGRIGTRANFGYALSVHYCLYRHCGVLRSEQYSDDTATMLAAQLLDGATDGSWIAVVSAPSVFIQIKKLLVSDLVPPVE